MAGVQKRKPSAPRHHVALGFISGFVDTLGFIALYGCSPPISPATWC
jgi:hypothetical protein